MADYTFPELEYKRPDAKALCKEFKALSRKAKRAKSYEEVKRHILDCDKLLKEYSEMSTIGYIRHTLDTTDKFYESEIEYLNKYEPRVSAAMLPMADVALDKRWQASIRADFGDEMIEMFIRAKKSFSPKIILLAQREAALCSRYQKIMARAKIPFDGEDRNLYGMLKYFEDADREKRKAAWKAYISFFAANEGELERIFDKLVRIRNKKGRRMGFDNFVPLGYLDQQRSDYGRAEIEAFREQVRSVLVPFCERLYEAQRKRLGVDQLMCWDEKRIFPDGNADPIGTEEELVEKARAMYHELSDETKEFIDFMISHKLMDLTNRPGKASTGYCTALPTRDAPFIFSCFNGTSGDVHVLTHELGHAFASYRAMRAQKVMFTIHPGTDIAEIHSMSMEQFCYPWAESFFGEAAEKFRFSHLQEALTFVPFGVAVDEFQHIVYDNPRLTPKQRTMEWRKLEQKYMPWRKYDPDDEFSNRGGWWYHKIHIFLYPMYYINYTLTTMGALEMGKRMQEDRESCWRDFLALCDTGGSRSYLATLRLANLSVPFEAGSVERATSAARRTLEDIIAKEAQ